VLGLIDNQVRSLRVRQLIDSYTAEEGKGKRTGAYWGIRSDMASYDPAYPLPCPPERTAELAHVPTRLKRLDDRLQERLINWGYAVCDAALRKHIVPDLPRPKDYPYPESKI
jgi:NTE family protein